MAGRNSMPQVSVVMPAYNAEKYIREAIDSILAQTFTDFEFIILDDGSTDHTAEIVRSYTDSRIRFYQNEHNMGVAATLNRGLDLARGEYIARMDADDISLPERFSKQAWYMDGHPDIAVLATNVENFGADIPAWSTSATSEALAVDLIFNCCLCHPTVMMSKRVLKKDLRYDESYNGMEDYELWERLIQHYRFACVEEKLYRYRLHSGQVSAPKSEKQFERYLQLKKRILSRLSIDVSSDAFLYFARYCYGGFKLQAEEKKQLRDLLLEIERQNLLYKKYDHRLLMRSLRGIVLGTFGSLKERRRFVLTHMYWYQKSVKELARLIFDLLFI